jgi:hypothetical protein
MSVPQHYGIEQRCRTRLKEILSKLNLTGVTTIAELCHAVGEARQRAIYLIAVPLPPGLTGMWIPMTDLDIIAYADQAPPIVRSQTIAHELAHLLAGHHVHDEGETSPHLLALFTHLAPERIQQFLAGSLGRTGYDSEEEYEAEFLGSLIEQVFVGLPSQTDRDASGASVRLMRWTNALRGS